MKIFIPKAMSESITLPTCAKPSRLRGFVAFECNGSPTSLVSTEDDADCVEGYYIEDSTEVGTDIFSGRAMEEVILDSGGSVTVILDTNANETEFDILNNIDIDFIYDYLINNEIITEDSQKEDAIMAVVFEHGEDIINNIDKLSPKHEITFINNVPDVVMESMTAPSNPLSIYTGDRLTDDMSLNETIEYMGAIQDSMLPISSKPLLNECIINETASKVNVILESLQILNHPHFTYFETIHSSLDMTNIDDIVLFSKLLTESEPVLKDIVGNL